VASWDLPLIGGASPEMDSLEGFPLEPSLRFRLCRPSDLDSYPTHIQPAE
jgi:hypothetical protein